MGANKARCYGGRPPDIDQGSQSEHPDDRPIDQILHGDFGNARDSRQGGRATILKGSPPNNTCMWATASRCPPIGRLPLRVAAITTNLGWPAGAVTLASTDYTRGWQSTDPTALEVNFRPGVSLAAGKHTIQAALGPHTGLLVQTVEERDAQADSDLRQGLEFARPDSTLLLITGALAVAASLGAAIWQRRARLAAMKTWGYDNLELWRSLLLEGTILLTIGRVDGALLGLYGHALADRWLRLTTDFPHHFQSGLNRSS